MLAITPTKHDKGKEKVESDLARLERENWELKRQLEMVGRGKEVERGEGSKYEELMREVVRLQNTVSKVSGWVVLAQEVMVLKYHL